MSLFSAITHDGSFPVNSFRPKRMALAALAILTAVAIAASITLRPSVTAPVIGANAGELTPAEFIELNTVALVGSERVYPLAIDNGFLYWNVGALEYAGSAVSAAETDRDVSDFLYWNTESIDYNLSGPAEPTPGPR